MYLLCKEFIAVHSGSDGVTTFENVGHTVGQIVFTGQFYFVTQLIGIWYLTSFLVSSTSSDEGIEPPQSGRFFEWNPFFYPFRQCSFIDSTSLKSLGCATVVTTRLVFIYQTGRPDSTAVLVNEKKGH